MADKSSRFAGRLRELREEAGLTQEQLAAKAGMHKLGIAKLERGERGPSWSTVVALCEALGVPCQAFLEAPKTSQKPRRRGRPPKEAKPARKSKRDRS
jgi:transcriptional regulator with XRE-family HTH domain